MNKKFCLGIFVSCLLFLSACSAQKNSFSWLNGAWHSNDNKTTVTIKNQGQALHISGWNKTKIVAKFKRKEKDKSLFQTDQGVNYYITKIDKTHITFYQEAPAGSLGLTATIDLHKN